jgi:hypothetical protein
MPSLSTIGNQLKTEADAALTKAATATDPIEKREWLEVADRAMQTYQRTVELQRYPHA